MRKTYRINHCRIEIISQKPRIMLDKAHIEHGIMSYHRDVSLSYKLKKLRYPLGIISLSLDLGVSDTRKLGYPLRNMSLRVYKL